MSRPLRCGYRCDIALACFSIFITSRCCIDNGVSVRSSTRCCLPVVLGLVLQMPCSIAKEKGCQHCIQCIDELPLRPWQLFQAKGLLWSKVIYEGTCSLNGNMCCRGSLRHPECSQDQMREQTCCGGSLQAAQQGSQLAHWCVQPGISVLQDCAEVKCSCTAYCQCLIFLARGTDDWSSMAHNLTRLYQKRRV